jgi:hypothetical protein
MELYRSLSSFSGPTSRLRLSGPPRTAIACWRWLCAGQARLLAGARARAYQSCKPCQRKAGTGYGDAGRNQAR